MKNHWIDTTHSSKGEKIYEMFDPDSDGEIVKESMQEWLCDNRHQITECIRIVLRNHEFTYAEWFKYVNAQSGPDELALYSLSRKYHIHTSVYNKSYVWTNLMNHVSRTDEEIFKLSGVNLVYLGPTVYGIIHEIWAPQPGTVVLKPGPSTNLSKCSGKTTCRDSSHSGGRKYSNKARRNTEAQRVTNKDRPKTLSEKWRANYGISDTNITTKHESVGNLLTMSPWMMAMMRRRNLNRGKNGAKSLTNPEVHCLHQEYRQIEQRTLWIQQQ